MKELSSSNRKLISEGYSGNIYLTKIQLNEEKWEKAVIKKFNK